VVHWNYTTLKYNIQRIELPTVFDMKTVNSFLVQGEYITLIDTGENTEESWNALIDGISELGLKISDIEKILITHAHVDHIGMASRVSQESGAKVHVSELVYPWATNLSIEWARRSDVLKSTFNDHLSADQNKNFMPIFQSFFGQVSNIWENLSPDQVEIFDITKDIDISGKSYEILHCPGHTWTQTCFLQENGDFFSADMLLKLTPTCVIEGKIENLSERNKSMPQLLHSFEMLLQKNIGTIYPGHYNIMDNHTALITKQLERIHLRKNQVFTLVENGTQRFFDLFNSLYGGKFNFPGLVMTLGYLDLLLDEGRIRAGVLRFKFSS